MASASERSSSYERLRSVGSLDCNFASKSDTLDLEVSACCQRTNATAIAGYKGECQNDSNSAAALLGVSSAAYAPRLQSSVGSDSVVAIRATPMTTKAA